MDIAMPAGQLLLLVLALSAAGLITGFLAGLLGVGGGAILVPILYETFTATGVEESVRMHLVLGTALAVIVPTSLRSAYGHWSKGAMETAVVRRLGPYVAAGVVIGVIVASVASASALKWVWVVSATAMALKMAAGRDDWRLGDRLPASWGLEVTALAIGTLSALLSIGGGMFIVALLTVYAMPILSAVATSSGFGPIISIPGALGFVWAGWGVPGRPPFSLGYVNLLGAGLVIPASLFAVPWGVRVAHAIPKRKLELAFATFLTCVALRFLWSLH